MKRFFRRPLLSISLFIICVIVIFPIFNTTKLYISIATKGLISLPQPPAKYLFDSIIYVLSDFYLGIFGNDTIGLPQIRLYISERSQKSLLSDVPGSLKHWQNALFLYPDGKYKKVKVRHRGDANTRNYLLRKKSWRIKTRKKNMINGYRVYNYMFSSSEPMIRHAASAKMAHEMGVLTPEFRLVELFINDKSQGMYFESEHLDESFLRSNNIMPVNFYKGDVDLTSYDGLVAGLYESTKGWSKLSYNNRYPENDMSDVLEFTRMVNKAGSSEADLLELKQKAPFEAWAMFSAYQILSQNWHTTNKHNTRIIIDDQKGIVLPVAWDPAFFTISLGSEAIENDFILNRPSHPLFSLYKRHSEFILKEQEVLYNMVVEGDLLKKMRSYLNETREPFRISLRRDYGRLASLPFARTVKLAVNPEDTIKLYERLETYLLMMEHWLKSTLKALPKSTWVLSENGIQLFLDGYTPLGDIKIVLSPTSPIPEKLVMDTNNNKTIDPEDREVPFDVHDKTLCLRPVWLANRMIDTWNNWYLNDDGRGEITKKVNREIKIVSTRFDLIADKKIIAESVSGANALTGKRFMIPMRNSEGIIPFRWNYPVYDNIIQETSVWSGIVEIDQTKIFNKPIRIKAGTKIRLKQGVSIIFRDSIVVEGTSEFPVIVQQADDKPWGVFALQGMSTAGSVLKNMIIEGGSGDKVDGINYLGMLSIHDTKDIEIIGLVARNNYLYDDMVHIVYSQNVILKDIELKNAFSDAIDVDISDVNILGGMIEESKNDGLDCMTSNVLVKHLKLVQCQDKGISIGEASDVIVQDTKIASSGIGIEIKDGSIAKVSHTNFVDNRVQVNAYKKNWRYGNGGQANISKSIFTGQNNEIKADKDSKISIKNSSLFGPFDFEERVLLSKDLLFSDYVEFNSKTHSTNKLHGVRDN